MATTEDPKPFTLLGPRELIGFVPAPDDDADAADDQQPLAPVTRAKSSDSGDSEDEEEEMHPMGYTENGALTFVTSLNSCLDFFFQVVPNTTPKERLIELLSKAWEEDPLMALKLVFQLRGVRGTGKSDKLNFYDAALWLYQHHPATLNANLAKIPQFGYYKDLLELLQRIIEGERGTLKRLEMKQSHIDKKKAAELKSQKRKKLEQDRAQKVKVSVRKAMKEALRKAKRESEPGYFLRKGAAARAARREGTLKPREERIAEDIENGKRLKQEASEVRKNKHLKLASRVVAKYNSEPEFAALYDSVSRVFADALAKDLEELNAKGLRKASISLAAKWCPSLDSSYDRQTLLCEGIACRYFPRSGFRAELDEHQYRVAAREKLRMKVLSPLRKALELPEVYMSAKEWSRLPYTRVASVAMKKYKELFLKKDEARFKSYLDEVEEGEKKIAAGALLPHEIVKEAIEVGVGARVLELQWRSMVEEMKKNGSLVDSISICDVSGSMNGEPMEVAIALGMLTAELAEEPWKNKLITFSDEPAFFTITGSTLREKHQFVASMPWDMSTNFQKVFDLLLEMARENKLPGERMVKRLFVYSDMEFDAARSGGQYSYSYSLNRRVEGTSWETDYAQICRKFEEAGYGEPPEIVFWNLRSGKSTPVLADQKGVAMVSGFSKNLLKLFMEKNGKVEKFTPVDIMKQAVSGPLYDDFVVV